MRQENFLVHFFQLPALSPSSLFFTKENSAFYEAEITLKTGQAGAVKAPLDGRYIQVVLKDKGGITY